MYRVFKIFLTSLILLFGSDRIVVGQESNTEAPVVVFRGLEEQYVPGQSAFDSATHQQTCKEVIAQLRTKGYWLANIDSTTFHSDSVVVHFFQGRKFDQVEVDISKHAVLSRMPKFLRTETRILSSPDEMPLEVESVLEHMEANGYPFASLVLDSATIDNDKLTVQLRLDPGTRITYDSLSISPQELVKSDFLSKYLGLNYGKDYDEHTINQVAAKIQHLPFMTLEKMNTSFRLKKAQVHLKLARQKVNRFNGLLGVIPGQNGEGAQITGELDLAINNIFQSGKKIEVIWKRLEPGAQQLHASYLHPILLGSPLDFNFELDQIRQDTIFSNRSLKLAFDYRPINNLQITMSYTNLLGNKLEDAQDGSGDFDVDSYGLALAWYKLDKLYNPKRGIKIKWITSVGRKSVRNDQTIPESTQYSFQHFNDWYQPMGKRSVFYLGGQGGIIFNDYLFLNDLFRLGGLRTIRGFNELVFFASKYALINMEWRYYLDDQSYLVAFYDQSWMAYEILSGTFDDKPSALGVGMEFNTDQGNFKILYGLGKRSEESFSFANSKIHFGYTAIF